MHACPSHMPAGVLQSVEQAVQPSCTWHSRACCGCWRQLWVGEGQQQHSRDGCSATGMWLCRRFHIAGSCTMKLLVMCLCQLRQGCAAAFSCPLPMPPHNNQAMCPCLLLCSAGGSPCCQPHWDAGGTVALWGCMPCDRITQACQDHNWCSRCATMQTQPASKPAPFTC